MAGTQHTITRWRLIDALEQAGPGSLVLIVAAAGYGKSTLLRQWTGTTSRACAVVQASPQDDAVALATAIAEALVPVLPAAAPLRERALRAEVDWSCDLLPPLLELASATPVALAIDDAHVLATPSSREMLALMAERWPAPSLLVLSGRERPAVPLVRGRLGAPLVTLGERDLDFDERELEQVGAAPDLLVDREELLALTGGWPAGIRLAAIVRETDLHGTATSVEAFLTDHVLSAFSAHELDYLGHVATLAPATARTIDRVLQRDDTLEALGMLAARGLPMVQVPADPDEPVIVHALLAEVLTRRLDRRSAGTTGGLVDLAVDTSLRIGEPSYAFHLLERHGETDRLRAMPYLCMFPLVVTGRTRELRNWMERFDPVERVEDPLLVLPYSNVGRPRDERQVRALFAPHAQDTTTILPDGLTPAIACERMLTAFGLQPADPEATDLRGGWRQTHGVTRAWDLYGDDRVEEAEEVLLGLRDSAHKYPVTNAVGLAKLAIIALETGRVDLAIERSREAARIVADARMEETALGFIVDAVELKLARRASDLVRAEAIATAARRKMATVGDGTLLERATTLIEVANLFADLGRTAGVAQSMLEEARTIIARWPSAVRLDRQAAQLSERLAAVAPGPVVPGADLITTAELRVLRFLPSHLTVSRIADELYVSPSTVKSHCQSIYRKLDVGTRSDAVMAATRLGLLA